MWGRKRRGDLADRAEGRQARVFAILALVPSLLTSPHSTLYQSLLGSIDSLPYLAFPYCSVVTEVRGSIPPRLFNAALSRPDSADAWQTSTTKGELQAGYLGSIDDTLSIRGKRDV